MQEHIYLDYAATSATKPPAVGVRLAWYHARESLSAGRGSYARSLKIGREITATRSVLAGLLGAESPGRIVFTHGGTEALNLAILGLLRPGDHVITTTLEHNSVYRPLAWLEKTRQVEVTVIPPADTGQIDPARVQTEIRPHTRLLCCVHASNVTGVIQPVQEICQLARQRGILTLIDAAQTVGHLPINIAELGCDLLAASAHKGLLAPLGTGFLYLRRGLETAVEPLFFGGTGTESEQTEQPLKMPDRYESGSLNVPGLLGLGAALGTVTADFIQEESQRQQELTSWLMENLLLIPGITVYAAETPPEQRIGVVSLSVAGHDPRIIETILDSHFHIEVRSGLHCAPRAHQWLGTAQQGGTVRLSLGYGTTQAELEQTIQAFRQICI